MNRERNREYSSHYGNANQRLNEQPCNTHASPKAHRGSLYRSKFNHNVSNPHQSSYHNSNQSYMKNDQYENQPQNYQEYRQNPSRYNNSPMIHSQVSRNLYDCTNSYSLHNNINDNNDARTSIFPQKSHTAPQSTSHKQKNQILYNNDSQNHRKENTRTMVDNFKYETNEKILDKRLHQIAAIKSTAQYEHYLSEVPKSARNPELRHANHPQTPPHNSVFSKRQWNGKLNAWAASLHGWAGEGRGFDSIEEMKLSRALRHVESESAERPPTTIAGALYAYNSMGKANMFLNEEERHNDEELCVDSEYVTDATPYGGNTPIPDSENMKNGDYDGQSALDELDENDTFICNHNSKPSEFSNTVDEDLEALLQAAELANQF